MVAALTLLLAMTPQAFNPAKSVVWVEDNGYRDVRVAVRDDLIEADCEVIVNSLKVGRRLKPGGKATYYVL